MSWKKESASTGLGGVYVKGGSKGWVFHFEDFEHMADPLDDPNEKLYGELIKEVQVS